MNRQESITPKMDSLLLDPPRGYTRAYSIPPIVYLVAAFKPALIKHPEAAAFHSQITLIVHYKHIRT